MGMCFCSCPTAGALQTLGWVINAHDLTDILSANLRYGMASSERTWSGKPRKSNVDGRRNTDVHHMQHQRVKDQSPSCSSDVSSPNSLSTCVIITPKCESHRSYFPWYSRLIDTPGTYVTATVQCKESYE